MNIWRQRIEDWRATRLDLAVRSHDDQITWNQIAKISEELKAKTQGIGVEPVPIVILAVPRSPMACALAAGLLASDVCGMAVERNTVIVMLPGVLACTSADAILIKATDLEMFKAVTEGYRPQSLLTAPDYLLLTKERLGANRNNNVPRSAKWLIQTSGTTRAPKIVMISGEDLINRAEGEIREFENLADDEILNALPLSHDVGFNQILSWLMVGFTLNVFNKLSSSELFRVLDQDSITGVSGTPLLWIGLLREIPNSAVPAIKNQTLKYLTVSGGSLDVDIINRLRSHFQRVTVIKTYGQTETFRSLISKTHAGEALTASLGFPLPGVKLELLDDAGAPVSGAGHGQLVHSGHGTMLGYMKASQDLEEPKLAGKVETGDYFDRTADGHYFYRGRRDDLIKRWEHRLFLSETEEAIREFPNIEQATVLHRPVKDARQNEMAAFVILKKGETQDVRNAVLRHCKTWLAPHKVPDEIFVLPTMPQTESLKVDRKQLLSYWENAVVKPRN